ncbi:hypothetical protein [Sulfoacidibacillus thermotolerans]|nr:hypothetical protein [Sulfoacidibacillus thermotolerans]
MWLRKTAVSDCHSSSGGYRTEVVDDHADEVIAVISKDQKEP